MFSPRYKNTLAGQKCINLIDCKENFQCMYNSSNSQNKFSPRQNDSFEAFSGLFSVTCRNFTSTLKKT